MHSKLGLASLAAQLIQQMRDAAAEVLFTSGVLLFLLKTYFLDVDDHDLFAYKAGRRQKKLRASSKPTLQPFGTGAHGADARWAGGRMG